MPWTTTYTATRRVSFLFGTLLLCNVLLAEDAARSWRELVRQAQDSLAREDYSTAAALAQRALAQAEPAPRSTAAEDLDLASALSTLGAARLALGNLSERLRCSCVQSRSVADCSPGQAMILP